MRRILMLSALVSLLAVSASAQFVAPGGSVPVVANLPGLNNTDWRTDVSVVNLATTDTSIVLLLQPEIKNGAPLFEPIITDPVTVVAGDQLTMKNIVETIFGLTDMKGALSIFATDGAPLVISARIYTLDDEGGSYGQNVEGLLVADRAWAPGIAHDDFYRTNFGIYLPFDPLPGEPVRFVVRVFDNLGELAGSGEHHLQRCGGPAVQRGRPRCRSGPRRLHRVRVPQPGRNLLRLCVAGRPENRGCGLPSGQGISVRRSIGEPGGRASARPQSEESVLGHPVVVVDGAEIAEARIGEEGDDPSGSAEFGGDLTHPP